MIHAEVAFKVDIVGLNFLGKLSISLDSHLLTVGFATILLHTSDSSIEVILEHLYSLYWVF